MNMATARTFQLAGMAVLAGVGYATTKDYLKHSGVSVKDIVDNVKGATSKVVGKVKERTSHKGVEQNDITELTARVTNFYIGVVQENEGLQFGTDVKIPKSELVFSSYAEAKMNLLNYAVPALEREHSELERELIAVAMDYGALVERTLSKEETVRKQEAQAEVVIEDSAE